ncbi:ribosomal RNA small subunit methyltransferase A [Candidatus Bathyarchaeota archaeon]|nr:ribosomal RNA small subunit methyltransferase A [Candidatus Bathyarchaeota archaeon]
MYSRGLPFQITPKKRLGQNFLTDRRVLERIVSHAGIRQDDVVLEVGPGLGALTELLQTRAGRVVAVEKDPELVQLLRKRLQSNPKIEIVEGDILRIPLPEYDIVVSTPPYNISSKLLFRLLEKRSRTIVLVLQREFAERLVAKPDTHEYSRLTVMASHKAHVEILGYVPAESFTPRPKVDSAVVRITPKESPQTVDEDLFTDLVRGLFTQRRRMLRRSLRNYLRQRLHSLPEWIDGFEVPDKRVYQASLEEFEKIARDLRPLIEAWEGG